MPTLMHYRPPVPVRTKPKPSLINWPIVAVAGACAVIFLAGTLVASWFVSRAGSVPKEKPARVAETPTQEGTSPLQGQVEEPAIASVASAPDRVAKEPEAVAAVIESKASEPLPPQATPACESFGTRVEFVSNPTDAARLARQENKLMFVLHISGNFEDDKFTWNNAQALRVNALSSRDVGQYLNASCVSTYQKVGTFRRVGDQKQGGNVASYFCTPASEVLHVVIGPVNAAVLLREARWVIETWKLAQLEGAGDGSVLKTVFRKAHAERFRKQQKGDIDVQRLAAIKNQQSRVHLLLTLAPLVKLEKAYQMVFEDIVGEKVSTSPVVEGE